jgi:hypothetical protein
MTGGCCDLLKHHPAVWPRNRVIIGPSSISVRQKSHIALARSDFIQSAGNANEEIDLTRKNWQTMRSIGNQRISGNCDEP